MKVGFMNVAKGIKVQGKATIMFIKWGASTAELSAIKDPQEDLPTVMIENSGVIEGESPESFIFARNGGKVSIRVKLS